MADVVVMGYRTQALAVPHHPNGLALLVWRQFWLGPEFGATFLGGSPSLIGTSKDAASFIPS